MKIYHQRGVAAYHQKKDIMVVAVRAHVYRHIIRHLVRNKMPHLQARAYPVLQLMYRDIFHLQAKLANPLNFVPVLV